MPKMQINGLSTEEFKKKTPKHWRWKVCLNHVVKLLNILVVSGNCLNTHHDIIVYTILSSWTLKNKNHMSILMVDLKLENKFRPSIVCTCISIQTLQNFSKRK